jgi:cell division protein YceG involved in septum cleavage
MAALTPRTTPYLYYVLCPKDGDGVHRFSETLAEHEANRAECLG